MEKIKLNLERTIQCQRFLDVRDEAHRFAIKNFRSTKRKNLTQHFLQDIPGIGPKTISKIYKEYQSMKSFQKAIEVHLKLNLNVAKVKKIQDCPKCIIR